MRGLLRAASSQRAAGQADRRGRRRVLAWLEAQVVEHLHGTVAGQLRGRRCGAASTGQVASPVLARELGVHARLCAGAGDRWTTGRRRVRRTPTPRRSLRSPRRSRRVGRGRPVDCRVRAANPARTSVSRCSRTVLGCNDVVAASAARDAGSPWARRVVRSRSVDADRRRSEDPPRGPRGVPGASEVRDFRPSSFSTVSTVLISARPHHPGEPVRRSDMTHEVIAPLDADGRGRLARRPRDAPVDAPAARTSPSGCPSSTPARSRTSSGTTRSSARSTASARGMVWSSWPRTTRWASWHSCSSACRTPSRSSTSSVVLRSGASA